QIDHVGLTMAYGFMSLYSARSTNVLGLVILLLAALFISVRGLTRAVEFTGGMMIQVHFPDPRSQISRGHAGSGRSCRGLRERLERVFFQFFHHLSTKRRHSLSATSPARRAAGDCGLKHGTTSCGGNRR